MRAASFLIPSTYLLHRMLALRLDKLPRLVRHRRSNARLYLLGLGLGLGLGLNCLVGTRVRDAGGGMRWATLFC